MWVSCFMMLTNDIRYYKWIANYATYDFDQGGDISFVTSSNDVGSFRMYALGDKDGNPRNQTGQYFYCELDTD